MPESLKGLMVALGLAGLVMAAFVGGRDGEYERKVRRAEFNEKFVHAALPKIGTPRVCQWELGKLVCYDQGRKRQPIVVATESDLPQ